jgi:hypothetical protein
MREAKGTQSAALRRDLALQVERVRHPLEVSNTMYRAFGLLADFAAAT